MSWNGSQNAGQPANGRGERPARPPQKKSLFRSTTTTPNYNSSPHNSKRAALVALALAALAGALYFALGRAGVPRPPQKNAPHRSTTTTTNYNYKHSAPTNRPARVAAAPAEVAAEKKPKYPKKPSNWNDMTRAEKGAWMNANWPREKAPPSEVIADFRKKPNPDGRKPIFTNTLHQELNGYVVAGRDMPPPEFLSDADAKKAFETFIEISPDDSEEVQARKQAVIDMLGEMADYMRDGGHANDYLQKIYQRQELEGEAVREVRKDVQELLEAGDREGAEAALEKYNAYLEGKGIAPVRVRALEKE